MLLLQRSAAAKNNPGRWTVVGGNAEASDKDLLATARREAAEELGGAASVPKYTLSGQPILTK